MSTANRFLQWLFTYCYCEAIWENINIAERNYSKYVILRAIYNTDTWDSGYLYELQE